MEIAVGSVTCEQTDFQAPQPRVDLGRRRRIGFFCRQTELILRVGVLHKADMGEGDGRIGDVHHQIYLAAGQHFKAFVRRRPYEFQLPAAVLGQGLDIFVSIAAVVAGLLVVLLKIGDRKVADANNFFRGKERHF